MGVTLKAPFPYFGGKSAVAAEVWRRFGNVKNYVEPFFGSGAVLLGRPHWRPDGPRLVETVNDADGLLANFWRAMTADAETVARHADWPVNEADLHARHLWLVGQRERITERLMADPEWFDARAAGWWVWGQCAAVMGNWCSSKPSPGRPYHGRYAIHARGVESLRPVAARVRHTTALCGDWHRVVSAAMLHWDRDLSPVGVFLDPPYDNSLRASGCYAEHDDGSVAGDVLAWALEHGDNPKIRICVAGYDVEHEALESAGWSMFAWQAHGSFGAKARANAKRERLWFSPHCLRPDEGQMSLFGGGS